jgi:zinc-binding alcohol dehydrogenase/oxidoreductase
MKALVLHGVGRPFVLEDVPALEPGPGEVVVSIQAAALNHRDLWIQKGQYAGLKFPIILGSDGCGVVTKLGRGVDPIWQDKEVIVNPSVEWGNNNRAQSESFKILGLPDNGTLAEEVCVQVEQLALKPSHLDSIQAAAVPLAGLTAYRAVFTRAQIKEGDKVLVTGIGGGVALFALAFAVAAGAEVFVTSGSHEKLEAAKKLGATGGTNYHETNWADQLKEVANGFFDAIIDSAGGDGFADLINLTKPGGSIAFFGATCGNPSTIELRAVFFRQLNLFGSMMGSPAEFAAMIGFIEQHRIEPVVAKVFPFSEANDALAWMEQTKQFGKIVLRGFLSGKDS